MQQDLNSILQIISSALIYRYDMQVGDSTAYSFELYTAETGRIKITCVSYALHVLIWICKTLLQEQLASAMHGSVSFLFCSADN
jgi:hypothetical protein